MKTIIFIGIAISSVLAGTTRQSSQGDRHISVNRFIDDLPAEIQESIKKIQKQKHIERFPLGSLIEGDVRFYLYTRKSNQPIKMDPTNLDEIDFKKPFKYIVHDWLQNSNTLWVQNMKDRYLSQADYNVVVVSWAKPAFQIYEISTFLSTRVGHAMAQHIMETNINPQNVHIIGHGVGAHIAGFVGKQLKLANAGKNIKRITALDPAGPAFQEYFYTDDDRLTKEDADVVDVTHTDSEIFGSGNKFGTVEFYPNEGIGTQPGCTFNSYDDGVSCDHTRSVLFFSESIISKDFLSKECNSWQDYVNGNCYFNRNLVYGESDEGLFPGTYFFQTNGQPPFARGNERFN